MAVQRSNPVKFAKTPLPFLHEDIITENLLIRLPVKSVGRFRCVLKSLCSFLSSPKFIRNHLNFHANNKLEGCVLLDKSEGAFCTINPAYESNNVSTKLTITELSDGRRIAIGLKSSCSVVEEKFEELPPPKCFEFDKSSFRGFSVMVLGGCLALRFWKEGSSDFWVMKEYSVQDSWTIFTVDEKSLVSRKIGGLGEDEIFYIQKGSGEKQELVAYNWRSGGGWRYMSNAVIPLIAVHGMMNFRESLLSPKNLSLDYSGLD